MSIVIGVPYKSQAHFDLHEMSDSFYYLIFNSDGSAKIIGSDSDDLNNPHSVIITSGIYRNDNPLTLIFGCVEDEKRADVMTARTGYHKESIIFDVTQSGPKIR